MTGMHRLSRCLSTLIPLLGLAAGQSPGPDYPLCASTSLGTYHHPGWEVLNLQYIPPQKVRERGASADVPSLSLDVVNAADGSRTVCRLRQNSTRETEDEDVVLNNEGDRAGQCMTDWVDRYDYDYGDREEGASAAARPAQAKVRLDTASRGLSIYQTWTCRGADGGLITFNGTASVTLDMRCNRDRETGIEGCGLEKLHLIQEPPLFLGPATVIGVSPPDADAPPSLGGATGGDMCNVSSSTTTFAGWQLLAMSYFPPHPQPSGSPYELASVNLEMRNLADGSRVKCYLRALDISRAETEGVRLVNDGSNDTLTRDNYRNGCYTGTVLEILPGGQATGEKTREQEWRWLFTPRVSFHTKTQELTVEQKWPCGGEGEREFDRLVSAVAARKLDLKCEETGNSMVPLGCSPDEYVFNSRAAPVLVGPGTLSSP